MTADIRTLARQSLTFPIQLQRYLAGATELRRIPDLLRSSLSARSEHFLELVNTHIASRSGGPYKKLLQNAGCEIDDLCGLVRKEGLEAALRKLAHEGVYLTAAELKGKQEVVRGSLRFRLNPDELLITRSGFVSQSSGSSGRPQRGLGSFDWLADQSLAAGAFVLAHGFESHRFAAFEPILPGVSGMMYMIMLARLGVPTERWFARGIPFHSRSERAYCTVIAHEMALITSYFGPGFARPEAVSSGEFGPIIDWITTSRRKGRRTCLRTVASNSARIAAAALDRGLDLEGMTFLSSGEPMTAAKKRVIEQAGGKTTVNYGFEPGSFWAGQGCAHPSHIDEMHIGLNTLALIESPRTVELPDRVVHPLLYTTATSSASRLLINAETGDYANLETSDCGCLMYELGLTLRIHGLRSYEKFTSEGLNYPIDKLTEILESRLPTEFGGGPCDYQLVEEEGSGAQTRLTLRVHPGVGVIDEQRVLRRLAEEIGNSDHRAKFMSELWRQEGTFHLVREEPESSLRGKALPVVLAVGRTDSRL